MTPREIYNLVPIRTSKGIYLLEKHFEDINFIAIKQEEGPIEVKYYANHSFDGERVWTMFSLWLNDKPFMICQEAGRGGRDYIKSFITDEQTYLRACDELRKLYKNKVDIFSSDENNVDLTEFYGCKLEHFYNKDLALRYKVGDIVEVMEYEVPTGYDMNRPKIRVRVEIKQVYEFNPSESYFGTQIDRRHDYKSGRIVFDQGNGNIGSRFSEQEVLNNE